jgi:hypothetical protein
MEHLTQLLLSTTIWPQTHICNPRYFLTTASSIDSLFNEKLRYFMPYFQEKLQGDGIFYCCNDPPGCGYQYYIRLIGTCEAQERKYNVFIVTSNRLVHRTISNLSKCLRDPHYSNRFKSRYCSKQYIGSPDMLQIIKYLGRKKVR